MRTERHHAMSRGLRGYPLLAGEGHGRFEVHAQCVEDGGDGRSLDRPDFSGGRTRRCEKRGEDKT